MLATPLSKAEKKWLSDVETLLLSCPSKRIGAYTIGDNCLFIYDKHVSDAWIKANPGRPMDVMDASVHHGRAGSALGRISAGFQIDSCAG